MEDYYDQVAGFTTNPTLMRKSGIINYRLFAEAAISIAKDKPISFEVFGDDPKEIIRQASKLSDMGDNVYVKIPAMFTDGESTVNTIHHLAITGVKLNVTAVMSMRQIDVLARALTDTPAILSIFAGRIADTGRDPAPFFTKAIHVKQAHTKTLWASPREVLNVKQAQAIGADIITLTPELINKMAYFEKDLEEYSLETCKMFYRDADGLEL